MALHIIGRCGNCQSLTSRAVGGVRQCRACHDKGVKPVDPTAKAKKSAAELPRHISDALHVAEYFPRSPDGEGFPRVVASIPGFGSIMLGGEGGEDLAERIARVWPGLSAAQIRLVVKYIDGSAAARIRTLTERPGRPKKSWVTDY